MREAREGEVGLIDEDADEEDKSILTRFPRRCVGRCCPKVIAWLEAMGYDQALIVKDLVHMCLYLSCIVSFFFAAMSINEVVSFKCLESAPDNDGDPITDSGGLPECILDAICGLIFFGNLRDSAVMLGSYDNDHQHLLNRKKELMAELKDDIEVAYRKASDNADKLYSMLVNRVQDDFKDMVTNASTLFDEFNNTFFERQLPHIGEMPQEQQEDLDLLRKLVEFLRRLLTEPGQISGSFCMTLQAKYKTNLTESRTAAAALTSAQQHVDLYADTLLLEDHLNASQKARSTTEKRKGMRQDAKTYPENLAREIVAPVRVVSEAFMTDLKIDADKIKSADASEHSDKLMGFGRPPWANEPNESQLFRCCIPRLCALILRRLCCFCFCWPACCNEALKYYPPKRVRFGFIWFQIVSKLHERQIQGLIFSILLATFYGIRVIHTIVSGCQGNLMTSTFWGCAVEEFKKSAMLLALLFHIPATFLCLLRIRNLDAVIRIMEDIRKLQGLRSIIRDFDSTLEQDARRQDLLDKVTERVLERVKKFSDFRNYLRQNVLGRHSLNLNSLQRSRLRDHIKGINDYFSYAEDKLQPADKWLKVRKGRQDALIANVNEYADKLIANKWKLVDENSNATEDDDGKLTPPLSSRSSSFVGEP